MTPRLRRTCPGSCRPRRMRRSERTPLSAAVSPTRSVKEPQSAWIFIEAGGGVFFAFRVTSLCLGLLASSTCSIPAQEVTVLSSRALFSWYSVAKVILAFVWCMPYDVGMPKRGGSVHVATIRTKGAGDRVYTSYLLRRSYREGGRVRHENLGNLSHLPEAAIEAVRRVLAGEVLVAAEDRFQVTRSLPHGHVAAVLGVVRSLDLERLISREPSRERDLAVALICQRLLAPGSKLSATRRFSQTTLAEELTLDDAGEAELLSALDWLLGRQERIERTLARRHLTPGGFVLYDLSSSYFEGRSCPLAALGHSRDGKRGTLQITYGLICSPEGRPVAVEVFPGNSQDQQTLGPAVSSVTARFGIGRVIFVGDRGMITQAHAETLTEQGVGFISALKSPQIKALAASGELQLPGGGERLDLGALQSADEAHPLLGERLCVGLGDHAPVTHEDDPPDPEARRHRGDRGAQGLLVLAVAREDLHRHRPAFWRADKPVGDLQRAPFAVPGVTEGRQRTRASLEVAGGEVVEHEAAGGKMTAGQRPLDALLAPEEPIQGREELCLPCVIEREFFGERGLRKAPGGREFRPGGKEPLTDEGHRQVPLPGGLPGDEPFKVKRAHDAEHGGHVSVRQRARNLEAVLRRDQDLARQHPADRLDGRFG